MLLENEMIVDNFCGCGGASTAMSEGLEREVDIAVNHSETAIASHEANHPGTLHYQEDVWRVDPLEACKGRPVGLAWFSPDCTNHSRAKGGKPKNNKNRGLARLVPQWIKTLMPTSQHPRVIMLENVAEFMDWGPIDMKTKLPIKERKGENFKAWKRKLESYGYVVEHRLLVAADYGAPTTRKRLFLVARRDGLPIVWPEPTHGPGRALPWRTAAECIDFTLPCPSIFGRKKELKPATKRRIAVGIKRFVIEPSKDATGKRRPFVVPTTHPRDARVHDIDEPMRTITGANRGELALVTPFVSAYYGQGTGRRVDEPMATIPAGAVHHALIAPTLIQTSYGERKTGKPQAPRVLDLHKPIGTLMAGGVKHSVAVAFLNQHNRGAIGTDLANPMGTILTKRTKSLTVAHIEKAYGSAKSGASVEEPMPTVTSSGNHLFDVETMLDGPVDRRAEVRAFLLEYAGVDSPFVTIDGVVYEITDIGMRMLQPKELLVAQGFPPDYDITLTLKPATDAKALRAGKNGVRTIGIRTKPLTKTHQVELIGNSVSPPPARALVRANFPKLELRMAS